MSAMNVLVQHIFTFHDHLFKICTETDGSTHHQYFVEDELGTRRDLKDGTDLREISEACGSILQAYRDELVLPQGAS